jgi:aspartyl-tRNA(Asn)/glutamyl-tRNA(Gln) amidotransferase subunit A
MTALHDLTLVQLAAQLRQRKVSVAEAAQHFLARARQHDALGAYLATDE